MEDPSSSTKDSNIEKGEVEMEVFGVARGEPSQISPDHVSLDISAEPERRTWRILHRVPPHVRENKKHIYDPVVLSLGPYHDHRQPQFRQTEELKDEVLNVICGAKDKSYLRREIQKRVDEIRHFYGGVSKDVYGDEELAEMMFRDACFVIYYMAIDTDRDGEKYSHIVRRLGMSGVAFLFRDFLMLENQIPLQIIKLLISLTFDDDDKDHEGEALLYNFLSVKTLNHYTRTRAPWKDGEEPLHLLEACRAGFVKEENSSVVEAPIKNHCHWTFKSRRGGERKSRFNSNDEDSPVLPSVTELKAKGIDFGPSSNCLKDISFTSYWFYGKLQLPIKLITNNTHIFFSNLIALEMSPETDTDYAVISYIHFMKSLIDTPKDVKQLRRKGILTSILANDEEIVKMFKEIDTYAAHNEDFFEDLKMRINKHCNSKAKTWMAELAYTYFRSPWTAIALFAATFLLCLTFLQTYYTINPRSN